MQMLAVWNSSPQALEHVSVRSAVTKAPVAVNTDVSLPKPAAVRKFLDPSEHVIEGQRCCHAASIV
jgi:hypothetical protein